MQEQQTIKIVIADSHEVVASGLAQILSGIPDFQVIGQAKTGEEAFHLLDHDSPEIVIIDIDLPGPVTGIEVIRRLHRKSPLTRIVILTNLVDEAVIHEALREGVLTYLLKNSSVSELVHAVRTAHDGLPTLAPEVTKILIHEITAPDHFHLTSRERQVLQLLVQGLNNHGIAKKLNISLSTVQFHVSNILNKLGVQNRIEATAFAFRHKLAD
jgi:NarL family two-component system response regulator LiaR